MKLRVQGRTRTVVEFERAEFLAERWRYEAGNHVTFLAPTQQGKTTLAYQLADGVAHQKLPMLSLIMKKRDKTVRPLLRQLGHPELQSYPPPLWRRWKERPPGWALWPKRSGNVRADNIMLQQRFGDALNHVYDKGNHILFADETVGLTQILKLSPELLALWTQGAGMGAGVWAASQKPSHIPTWAYNQAEHLFLGPEPDFRNRKRFGEIGGIDPKIVEAAVMELERFQWIYIRRTGTTMCLIRA